MIDHVQPPRKRGRPCKNPPWLREVAGKVARGVPLRRALWSLCIYNFTESELKNVYRLKRFREFYETAKIAFYRETSCVPTRSRPSSGERYLAARVNAMQMERHFR